MSSPLLTSRARVLVCIARNPTISYDEIAEQAHVARRQVPRIIGDLVAAGCISRERPNRRNRYTVNPEARLDDDLVSGTVGAFLAALGFERSS
jgi:DNA-binding MarR family transcriptional regulator